MSIHDGIILRAAPVFKSNSTEKVQPRQICSISTKLNTTATACGIHYLIKYTISFLPASSCAGHRTGALLFTHYLLVFCIRREESATSVQPLQCVNRIEAHGSISMHTGGALRHARVRNLFLPLLGLPSSLA